MKIVDTYHHSVVSKYLMKIPEKFNPLSTIISAIIIFTLTTFSITEAFTDENTEKEMIIAKTVEYLKENRVRANEDTLKTIANTVYEESQQYNLDYRLILAVMKVESNFRHNAISRKGARGLLQIKPALAKHIAKDAGVQVRGAKCLYEPEKNIKIGVNYLSKLMDMFENLYSALHAYNVGPAKVKKTHTTDDNVPITRFTKKVLKEYQQMVSILPDPEVQQDSSD
jgi:soluble lytic murein transglycosylase